MSESANHAPDTAMPIPRRRRRHRRKGRRRTVLTIAFAAVGTVALLIIGLDLSLKYSPNFWREIMRETDN